MNWAKLAKIHEHKIKHAMQSANWSALKNRNKRFVVYLWEDGYVSILEDVAGGNHFHRAVLYNRAVQISEHCYQHINANPAVEQMAYKDSRLNIQYDACLARMSHCELSEASQSYSSEF